MPTPVFGKSSIGIGPGFGVGRISAPSSRDSVGKPNHGRGTIGQLQGLNLGTASSIFGDSPSGRSLQVGMSESFTEGNPTPPSLKLRYPGFHRFRWTIQPGVRQLVVTVKQVANVAPFPSVVIKANPSVGVGADIVSTSAGGISWVTIGPVSFTATALGYVWVELHNNCRAAESACYFDHLVLA